jgi:tripartite-type tricarboxylate transporter receptor subunit TctC
MNRRELLSGLGTLLIASALPARAADSFPSRPLRIVVPFGPGGVADLTVRVVAQEMSTSLGQPVIIDNKPGAGGVVAAQSVARAEPDGTTLLLMSNANAVSVGLFKSLPYDTLRDFKLLSTLGTFDLVLVAPANSPFKTVGELLARAKAEPGKLNLGTINTGSTQNLAAELLKSRAGVDIQIVPFNGSPAVMTALRGGQVDAAIEILAPMAPQIKGGAVRALAVLGEQRSAALPQVPTAREAGISDYNATSWNALAVPAGTSDAIVTKLHDAIAQALDKPSVQSRLRELTVTPRASTPAQAQALLASEIKRWGEVIERAGIPRQ